MKSERITCTKTLFKTLVMKINWSYLDLGGTSVTVLGKKKDRF